MWNDRFAADVASVCRMAAAGVHIATGTDTEPYGKSLHLELELLVKAGLTPLQALRAATYDAARCIRAEEDLGSVEKGKLAYLFLVDGDPTRDIRDARNVWLVVKGGCR